MSIKGLLLLIACICLALISGTDGSKADDEKAAQLFHHPNIVSVKTMDQYRTEIETALGDVLLVFYSGTCGHCFEFGPVLTAAANNIHDRLTIATINCQANGSALGDICRLHQVGGFPNFRFLAATTDKRKPAIENFHIPKERVGEFLSARFPPRTPVLGMDVTLKNSYQFFSSEAPVKILIFTHPFDIVPDYIRELTRNSRAGKKVVAIYGFAHSQSPLAETMGIINFPAIFGSRDGKTITMMDGFITQATVNAFINKLRNFGKEDPNKPRQLFNDDDNQEEDFDFGDIPDILLSEPEPEPAPKILRLTNERFDVECHARVCGIFFFKTESDAQSSLSLMSDVALKYKKDNFIFMFTDKKSESTLWNLLNIEENELFSVGVIRGGKRTRYSLLSSASTREHIDNYFDRVIGGDIQYKPLKNGLGDLNNGQGCNHDEL